MSFNRYYQDELIALRELGREFSQRNPALSPFFETPGRDPDVERILEGFAFLTGRLHQKLDDELPEITHSLFNLLWPHYLRPMPACSIIRYEPSANTTGEAVIPKNSLVESAPVQGTRCRFRTVYETQVFPLRLTDQTFMEKEGRAHLVLSFESLGVPLENLSLSSLRFFLTGEKGVAQTIYFTMLRKVREVGVVLFDSQKKRHTVARINAEKNISPVGFRESEFMLPYPPNAFPGYCIIQEYLCFPEKFLFVDVSGLEEGLNRDVLSRYKDSGSFELHFALDELPESFESFKPQNWQLFCTPVVNLFSMDATPLTVDQKRSEYRIVPDPRLPYHYAVFSVDNVSSWGHDNRGSRRYSQFESFEHEAELNAPAYYRLRLRPSHMDGGTEFHISISYPPENPLAPQGETISLELTCTNRFLPGELGVGDIGTHADNSPDAVSFRNITPVVPSFNPPLEGDLLWRLLSNMSLNYVSLTNIPALRAIIAAYNFRARYDRPHARMFEKNLKGMVSISCSEADRIHKGLPVRGAVTTLVLDQRFFSSEGDMFLFASALNEFFALYATVNSFHRLVVVEAKRKEEYQWPARLGRMHL